MESASGAATMAKEEWSAIEPKTPTNCSRPPPHNLDGADLVVLPAYPCLLVWWLTRRWSGDCPLTYGGLREAQAALILKPCDRFTGEDLSSTNLATVIEQLRDHRTRFNA